MPKYIDLLRSHSANGELGASSRGSAIDGASSEDRSGRKSSKKKAAAKRKKPTPSSNIDEKELSHDPELWLTQCVRIMRSFLKASARQKTVRADKLWEHLKPQIESIVKDTSRLSSLELKLSENTAKIRATSEEFGGMLEKSMNMLILSIKIGLQLKMSHDEIVSLLLASMLHHVGLARVPIAIRHKSSALTREERQVIREATIAGVTYLRNCGIDDVQTLKAIEQSQERMDSSGPLGLHVSEISFMARIVGLLSFFEALIHFRPYRQRLLPRDAIREIIIHHKASFDIVILKALIDSVSLYPIGTYVQLNSGDIGEVVNIHPRLPLRPTVVLRMNRQNSPIPPREINLTIQTTLRVERCMYPEELDQAKQ